MGSYFIAQPYILFLFGIRWPKPKHKYVDPQLNIPPRTLCMVPQNDKNIDNTTPSPIKEKFF